MNRNRLTYCFAIFAFSTGFSAAVAQQPPNPTPSDGSNNTAGGTDALLNLVLPAIANTAFGDSALYSNTSGQFNSAFGYNALKFNTTGEYNTAMGLASLVGNTTGSFNTAVGILSQYYAGSGSNNVSVGVQSLFATSGSNNVAIGTSALEQSGASSNSVAIGSHALDSVAAGSNIAIGSNAGSALASGSYNIYIGNNGSASESTTLRVGPAPNGHASLTRAFIGGIYGVSITGGSTVLIDSNGQLGTIVSSGRFKKDVADMGEASSKLLDLRPVTFHYKADTTQARQYGLIAEEVAKIYPDLVVRNASGEIDSVQYHELAPMLLNELQKQHREIEALRKAHDHDIAMLDEVRAMLKEQAAVLTRLQVKPVDSVRVASR